jgi:hypothetical protein
MPPEVCLMPPEVAGVDRDIEAAVKKRAGDDQSPDIRGYLLTNSL